MCSVVDRIRWTECATTEHAQWLNPYSYPSAFDVEGNGWLSTHFKHAVRVLHPAYRDGLPVTWREIATERGVALGQGTSFYDVTGNSSPNFTLDGVFDTPPEQGSLPEEVIGVIYEVLGDAQFGLLWEGFRDPGLSDRLAGAAAVRNGATVYKAIEVSGSPTAFTLERSPSFWWPRSRSWCAATGLDSYDTLVASSSEQVLNALAAIENLEVQVLR